MPSLTIKNLPQPLYKRLKAEAKRHRRSLNSEVIACLERQLLSSHIDPDEFIEDIRRARQQLNTSPLTQEVLDRARNEGRP